MKLECSKCGGLRFVAQTAWVHVLNHDGTYMYQLDPRDKEYDKLFDAETIKHNIYCAKCGEIVHIGDDGDIDADLPIINKFKESKVEV